MEIKQEWRRWMARTDAQTRKELEQLENDEKELQDRFGHALVFGTGGLRGVMGAGPNRMNVYTVRQVTQGVAGTIAAAGPDARRRGVVIAFDSRHHSAEFAREAACVLAASGIMSYLFDELRPTPELSFAVRFLGCEAGINITASHNPKEYNGYKVYWRDGAQIGPERADEILSLIRRCDIFDGVQTMPYEEAVSKELVRSVGGKVDEAYLGNVLAQSVAAEDIAAAAGRFQIIYTPFHGAGYRLVPEALRRAGFTHVRTVAEQMVPDGDFPTVKSPNPEEKEGFSIAIEMAKRENIDLIIGTDPDSDRCGIVVRGARQQYVPLTGNQVGILLTDYLVRTRRARGDLPQNAAVVTTIVSTLMADEVCRQNGVALLRTLTGFKFIGEKIAEFQRSGAHTFLFGFEESYGYLSGTYTRDKDAVVASLLIAGMAVWYFRQGKTLYDALQDCYHRYGFYAERLVSLKMKGADAAERMAALMKRLRGEGLKEIGGTPVSALRDYLSGKCIRTDGSITATGLPTSDVLYFELADGCSVVVRPSGTEPKVKLYLLVRGSDDAQTKERLARYESAMRRNLQETPAAGE